MSARQNDIGIVKIQSARDEAKKEIDKVTIKAVEWSLSVNKCPMIIFFLYNLSNISENWLNLPIVTATEINCILFCR